MKILIIRTSVWHSKQWPNKLEQRETGGLVRGEIGRPEFSVHNLSFQFVIFIFNAWFIFACGGIVVPDFQWWPFRSIWGSWGSNWRRLKGEKATRGCSYASSTSSLGHLCTILYFVFLCEENVFYLHREYRNKLNLLCSTAISSMRLIKHLRLWNSINNEWQWTTMNNSM